MEQLGRVPGWICPVVKNLGPKGQRLATWRAGRIVTGQGRLQWIQRRWLPYRASRLRVVWDRVRRPLRECRCELYYHHRRGNPDFLVLGYVHSHPAASLSSFYCATLVLDEIARMKGSHAIVTELSNDRLSDRLMERWGWERHCLAWSGRHFIKRFYGTYRPIPDAWRSRCGIS